MPLYPPTYVYGVSRTLLDLVVDVDTHCLIAISHDKLPVRFINEFEY